MVTDAVPMWASVPPSGGLLIGSLAASMRGVDLGRKPKDQDWFSRSPLPGSGVETYWHPNFEEWLLENRGRVATLNELTTIKLSHAFWDLKNGSWEKHMRDLELLQRAGGQAIGWLYELLYPVWEERYGKKRLNLDMSSDDFFGKDYVKRIYDHDSIHVTVAHFDRPLYESVLKDGSDVDMDMKKVWALGWSAKVRLFQEEVYATALERILIPQDYRPSPTWAYRWALKQTITSLTKGESARFIAENYATFKNPGMDYLARHMSRRDKLIPLKGN